MIGLSLSFCVKDIASGKVKEEDVEKIVASTAFCTPDDFEEVLRLYQSVYWRDLPVATSIARRLYTQGKIEQPRLQGKPVHSIVGGYWK